jgi:hypothetical protein
MITVLRPPACHSQLACYSHAAPCFHMRLLPGLQMVKEAIGDIERLDGALKRQEGDNAVALAEQAQKDIGAVTDVLAAGD